MISYKKKVDVKGFTVLYWRVLANSNIPKVKDLFMVYTTKLRKMVVEEVAHQLIHRLGCHVPWNYAEETFKHLAQCLHQHGGLIGYEKR